MRHLLLQAQAWWDTQRFDQSEWQVAEWRDQKVRHIQLHVAKALGKELTYDTQKYIDGPLQIKYIPKCSHWVQNDCPHEVNTFLLKFYKEISLFFYLHKILKNETI